MKNDLRDVVDAAVGKGVPEKPGFDSRKTVWIILFGGVCFLIGTGLSVLYISEQSVFGGKYVLTSFGLGIIFGVILTIMLYALMLKAHEIFFGVRR